MKYNKIIEEIVTGGSDRRFYRIEKNKKTYILIEDKNIGDYVKILNHLLRAGIGVPQLFEVKENQAVVEDLGSNTLYKLMQSGETNWLALYRMAIVELVKLQIDGFPGAPVNNYYDEEHIKWEQDYFKEFFIKQLYKIPDDEIKEIDEDLKKLHREVSLRIKPISNFLMHRDYQSQNIFIKDGKIRIVDFQSARIGPFTYDLASLLRDAYVVIDKNEEKGLIEFYLKCLIRRGIKITKRDFLEIYKLTAIQRNMQALGAFANLSLNKGKVGFKKYIPNGLRLLKRGLKEGNYLNFLKLINETAKGLGQR